jgi:hypothetical protein
MRFVPPIVLLLALGCHKPVGEDDAMPDRITSADVQSLETLGSLETRHGTLTIVRTTEGPRYTIVSSDGVLLAALVDDVYVAEHLPDFAPLTQDALGTVDEPFLMGLGYVED